MQKENKKLAHKSIPVDGMDFKVCFVSLHSLGVALSRGHGKYFFRGNVTIEEGKMLTWSVLSFPIGLTDELAHLFNTLANPWTFDPTNCPLDVTLLSWTDYEWWEPWEVAALWFHLFVFCSNPQGCEGQSSSNYILLIPKNQYQEKYKLVYSLKPRGEMKTKIFKP